MWKSFIYPRLLPNLFGGSTGGAANQIDFLSDTIKAAFLDSTYSPASTDEFYSDVSGDEISVTGYSAGGVTLGSKSISYSSTYNEVKLDAADGLFTSDSVVFATDARYVAVYDDTVSTKPLIGYVDFGSVISQEADTNVGNTFGPMWSADGLFHFQTWAPGMVSWYGRAIENAFGGSSSGEDRRTDFLSDTIKFALLSSSHTPNLDTHEVFSDVSGDEVSGSGYSSGGIAAGSKTLTLIGKRLLFDAADLDYGTISATNARYAVGYNDTNSDKPLLWLIDLLANQSPSSEDLTLVLPGGGFAALAVA